MLQLFVLFTTVPLVELWLLFKLSEWLGFWTTIAIVLGTGIAGASLARWQGWRAIQRLQNELRQGILPTQALGDGVLILVAAVLLVTPGVITDVLGLLLLIPPVRAGVRRGLRWWLARHAQWEVREIHIAGGDAAARPAGDEIIDARVIDTHVVGENDD